MALMFLLRLATPQLAKLYNCTLRGVWLPWWNQVPDPVKRWNKTYKTNQMTFGDSLSLNPFTRIYMDLFWFIWFPKRTCMMRSIWCWHFSWPPVPWQVKCPAVEVLQRKQLAEQDIPLISCQPNKKGQTSNPVVYVQSNCVDASMVTGTFLFHL